MDLLLFINDLFFAQTRREGARSLHELAAHAPLMSQSRSNASQTRRRTTRTRHRTEEEEEADPQIIIIIICVPLTTYTRHMPETRYRRHYEGCKKNRAHNRDLSSSQLIV